MTELDAICILYLVPQQARVGCSDGKLIDLSENVGHPERMVDVGSPLGITPLLILVFDSSKVGCSYHCCNVIIRHFSLKQKRSGAL